MEYEIEYEIGIDDIVIPSCACKYEAGGLAPELPVSPHSILSWCSNPCVYLHHLTPVHMYVHTFVSKLTYIRMKPSELTLYQIG